MYSYCIRHLHFNGKSNTNIIFEYFVVTKGPLINIYIRGIKC